LTQNDLATALGISPSALWSLSGNPAFPRPTSNDGAGNVVWNASDITAFQSLMTQATANGWRWGTDDLPAANWG
jgi:predicted DNA-binding transcriptional regulator AlpA